MANQEGKMIREALQYNEQQRRRENEMLGGAEPISDIDQMKMALGRIEAKLDKLLALVEPPKGNVYECRMESPCCMAECDQSATIFVKIREGGEHRHYCSVHWWEESVRYPQKWEIL